MNRVLEWLGRRLLAWAGWRIVGERPAVSRYVLITAPHTSNWDFLFLVLYGMALGIRTQWVGKHTLFRAPFGALMRALGGIPVRRDAAHQMVDQLVERFGASERLVLAMPPEGSRSRTPHWKSGFYYVARGANVPIVMSFLDFSRREGGIGPMLSPGGDIRSDMDRLRAFYADKRGLFPDQESPVRLKQEDDAD